VRILDELGDELSRAAHHAETRRGGGRQPSLRRTVVLAVLGLFAATGVAFAAASVIKHGDPLPTPPASAVPPELTPRAGSARLNALNVVAPDGGPMWDVRTARSRTGAVCASVGQLVDGELGIVGLDGTFHALPVGAADTCSVAQRGGFTLAGARGYLGRRGTPGITVVSGVAGSGVRRVSVVAAGTPPRTLRLGVDRAFLAIFSGQPDAVRPRLTATLTGGAVRTLRFADTGATLAPDPSGGAPWTLSATPARRPGLRCVQARRTKGPDSPTPTTYAIPVPAEVPARCGPRGQAFVATQRFVPLIPRVGVGYATLWGTNVARTIIWGGTGGATRGTLLGAPTPTPVTIDRTHGTFMAVVSGRVDPRRLSIRLGGQTLRGTTAVGRRGQPLRAEPVPPSRSVASVLRTVDHDPLTVTAGSVAEGPKVDDPAGGPAWRLRSWKARIDADTPVGPGTERALLCFAVGQAGHGSALQVPLPGGRTRTVGTGPADGRCNGPRWLRDNAASPFVQTFVADPDALDPKPTRIVVSGLLGDHVRSARLLGAGEPRRLELGPHGSFLVVLDPRYAGAALRVRQTDVGGRVRTARSDLAGESCRPSGPPVSVADPDGGPTWVAGVGTSANIFLPSHVPGRKAPASPRARPCRYVARLVGGRLAVVLDDELVIYPGPESASIGGTGSDFLSRRHPLIVDVRGPGSFSRPRTVPVTPAQVARRTLAGRTTVTGIAAPDVTSITLRSPRDIRTITPDARSHVYLAVYDGPFYGGEIITSAHLRSGEKVTQHTPISRG
jgi:hypothetical protein